MKDKHLDNPTTKVTRINEGNAKVTTPKIPNCPLCHGQTEMSGEHRHYHCFFCGHNFFH